MQAKGNGLFAREKKKSRKYPKWFGPRSNELKNSEMFSS